MLLLTGCGTTLSHEMRGCFSPYDGTRFDATAIHDGIELSKDTDFKGFEYLVVPIAIIDMPLSFTADTITLPISVINVIRNVPELKE